MNVQDILVRNLSVKFKTHTGIVSAVNNLSFNFSKNAVTGIIGETGCGKSVMAQAILRLLPSNAEITGRVNWGEQNILELDRKELSELRTKGVALIPQNPAAALNPVMRIGRQLAEALKKSKPAIKKNSLKDEVKECFSDLHLLHESSSFPFQLSGGMKQRTLAGIALIRDPCWIIADEPTKGLDSELRKTVAELLAGITAEAEAGLAVITHDLKFAEYLCDYIIVMYAGRIIESGPVKKVFTDPMHPYTKGLLWARPECGFKTMTGASPPMSDLPSGCPFHPRCPDKMEKCSEFFPKPVKTGEDREIYCYLYE